MQDSENKDLNETAETAKTAETPALEPAPSPKTAPKPETVSEVDPVGAEKMQAEPKTEPKLLTPEERKEVGLDGVEPKKVKRLIGGGLVAIGIALLLGGCSDASRAKLGGYGDEHRVEMYSGGLKVREWTATGKVLSESGSDGYYFNDKETGKLIEVSGDVVITKM